MHEIGVVRQMLKTVEEFAAENEMDEIVSIVLEIGDLSMIIPKYVEDIYSVIVKGTRFEHTELVIETVEGQGVCRQCKRAFPIVKNEGYCPRCGKRDADIISGRDFVIKEDCSAMRGYFVHVACIVSDRRPSCAVFGH